MSSPSSSFLRPCTAFSQSSSPWISLPLDHWKDFIQDRPLLRLPKRSFLYQQGELAEQLYIVHQGRIRITSYQADGSEKQLYIAEEGAMFGESSLTSGHIHSCSAISIVASSVYQIPAHEAIQACQNNWELNAKIIRVMQRKYNILFQQVMELSFHQSRQRIAIVILNLAKQYGRHCPQGIRIDLRFTHQDIASMINTSRVNVCNIINELFDQGLLCKHEGQTIIQDYKRLEDLARG